VPDAEWIPNCGGSFRVDAIKGKAPQGSWLVGLLAGEKVALLHGARAVVGLGELVGRSKLDLRKCLLEQALAANTVREFINEPAAPGDSRLPSFRALAGRLVSAVRAGTACQPDFPAGARVQRLVEIDALTQDRPMAARAAV
jgi:hypothetical protein